MNKILVATDCSDFIENLGFFALQRSNRLVHLLAHEQELQQRLFHIEFCYSCSTRAAAIGLLPVRPFCHELHRLPHYMKQAGELTEELTKEYENAGLYTLTDPQLERVRKHLEEERCITCGHWRTILRKNWVL